jgi:hypothetical protein
MPRLQKLIFNDARQKCQFTCKGKATRIKSNLAECRKVWNESSNCQPRLPYRAKLFFKIYEEIKAFHDKPNKSNS